VDILRQMLVREARDKEFLLRYFDEIGEKLLSLLVNDAKFFDLVKFKRVYLCAHYFINCLNICCRGVLWTGNVIQDSSEYTILNI